MKMKELGIGWGGSILVFVIGVLILALIVNPNFPNLISDIIEDLGPGVSRTELTWDELKTYRTEYIPTYIWNNYAHEEVKLSKISTATSMFELFLFDSKLPREENVRYSLGFPIFRYQFPENRIYLTNTQAIEEANQRYSSPSFTIVGIIEKKELDLGGYWGSEYENVIIIRVTDVEVHPS